VAGEAAAERDQLILTAGWPQVEAAFRDPAIDER
jgi:hypothetical protein